MIELREASEADLPAIVAIYNEAVAVSTHIWRSDPASLDDRRAWMNSVRDKGYPVLVALDGDEVVGYAAFGEFRSLPGYLYTVENSVYVRNEHRGKAIGGRLMRALIARAREFGKHVMIAFIDGQNLDSIRFHERLGFRRVALVPEMGRKLGLWCDLVILQMFLDEPGSPRDEP